jgi:hypothetical protein
MNRNGQSRRRQDVSFQTIIVGPSPATQTTVSGGRRCAFPPYACCCPPMASDKLNCAPSRDVERLLVFLLPDQIPATKAPDCVYAYRAVVVYDAAAHCLNTEVPHGVERRGLGD